MSKIEAGKLELSRSGFDMKDMLTNITNVINVHIEEKGHDFVVNLKKDVPLNLFGDELRLSQVITNLLANAIKFTPQGGKIILDIGRVQETEGDITLRFEVADNGIGISEEQQKRLFTSFGQADSSIAQKFGGTGLGLAISKHIVELMNGTIWIESEQGKGAKFIFKVKLIKVKNNENAQYEGSAEIASGLNESHADFNGHTILVAEDIAIQREIIAAVLKTTSISIDFAENGEIAASMFEHDPGKYSLIMMDIQMPDTDGYEAARRIRALDTSEAINIPIIAMTANVFREDIENCLAAGMNEHIGKPIGKDKLINVIGKYLK
jgi:CheY-like chemotaxis protein/two-component sensor histidine kinase